jgi:deoxyadenosine/deoxycytidine kinase
MADYDEVFRPPTKFVIVAGAIAAGKTTLSEAVSKRLGWELSMEPVKTNPFLRKFYAEMTESNKKEEQLKQARLMRIRALEHAHEMCDELVKQKEEVNPEKVLSVVCSFLFSSAQHVSPEFTQVMAQIMTQIEQKANPREVSQRLLHEVDAELAREKSSGDEHVEFPTAFSMQIFLLSERFDLHQRIVWSGKNYIQDRGIYEDLIFGKMLADSGKMGQLEYGTYRAIFHRMTNFLHRPDLIIYLDVKPEVAVRRMHIRGRECEKDVSLEYLTALCAGYENWLKTEVEGFIPLHRVDWNDDSLKDGVIDEEKMKGIIDRIAQIKRRPVYF